MPRLGRVLTAMVTPFDTTGRLDLEAAARLVEHLLNNGSDGIVVAGTTGEAPTLNKDEKLDLFRAVKATVGDRATVVAGTGSNNTAESIMLTQAVENMGIDGVMLTGPYYNKPSQEGFYQHFKAIAEITQLPIVLYNVPGRTSKNIETSTVLRLAREYPHVIALKEAGGDFEQISAICAGAPEGFEVYSGEDALTLPMLAVGCVGVISVVSHLVGQQVADMIASFEAGETVTAAKIHQKLGPMFKACFLGSGNPACVKRGLELIGVYCGGLRLPLVEASEADTAIMRAACADLGLL